MDDDAGRHDERLLAGATALERWSARVSATFEPLFRWVREHEDAIVAALQATGLQGPPPNWLGLSPAEQQKLMAVLTVQQDIPLAWTPPREVLSEVLACSGAIERIDVLLAARTSIGSAARNLLAEVQTPELAEFRSAVEAAWDAYRGGHDKLRRR